MNNATDANDMNKQLSTMMRFDKITNKPRFISKPNKLDPNGYIIFERSFGADSGYDPVGSYIKLDRDEPRDLTDKKVANLIGLMNGRKAIDLGAELCGTRTLFHVKHPETQTDPTHIVFRNYDGGGVSTENAIFQVKGGILNV